MIRANLYWIWWCVFSPWNPDDRHQTRSRAGEWRQTGSINVCLILLSTSCSNLNIATTITLQSLQSLKLKVLFDIVKHYNNWSGKSKWSSQFVNFEISIMLSPYTRALNVMGPQSLTNLFFFNLGCSSTLILSWLKIVWNYQILCSVLLMMFILR